MFTRSISKSINDQFRALGGLWTNRDFVYLWSAETISQFGSQITPVAIPLLAALTLDASPFEMGLLATAAGLPVLFFGFLAGAWVDRRKRRPVMIWTDSIRGVVLLSIPVAAIFDMISLELLIVVSLISGFLAVIFNSAWASMLPQLVRRSELADANSKVWATASVAQVAGPAAAGSLVALLTAPIVILMDAVSFFWSASLIRKIGHLETGPAPKAEPTHIWQEIKEGLQALVSTPVLRATALSSATVNLAGYMFLAVYVLYMTDDLGLSATGVGFVYAAGGIGALIGSVLAPDLGKRFGVGPVLLWSSILFGVFGMTVPAAIIAPDYALPLVVAAELLQWMTLTIFNILRISLRQALTPDHLQGRVSASNQVLVGGMAPLGSFMGGVIGQVWSVQAALIIGCVGMFLAAAWVWFSPTVQIREMPTGPEETGPQEAIA